MRFLEIERYRGRKAGASVGFARFLVRKSGGLGDRASLNFMRRVMRGESLCLLYSDLECLAISSVGIPRPGGALHISPGRQPRERTRLSSLLFSALKGRS
ncbi:hypothetical protein JW992_13300 [candidate division KSB1 bacterium]|nr:hypothetical protein [candidate division KSB1 bacterium]